MTSRPLKRSGHSSKRNSRKRGLSIPSLIFRLVALFSIAYSVYQFAPSYENASRNISQSTESAVSGAVNDKQLRSIEGDKFSKAKGKYPINNTAKFNGSFVNESEVNYLKNGTTEKAKTVFHNADEKKTTKKIKDDQKPHFNYLFMNGIFKAKLSNCIRKVNRLMPSKKNSNKKNIHYLLFEKNAIFTFFSEEKKRYGKYFSVMCLQGKQSKWAESAFRNIDFEKAARNCKEFKMEPISAGKEDIKNKQDENSAINTILFFGCALIIFVMLIVNFLYFVLEIVKKSNSSVLFRNTLYHSRSSKTLLMALGLLLSYAPVGSDVTLSTQGTYFQNDAPGRYLKGYVRESSVVPSLLHCQMRCDTLHLTCKSLNYVENEDGSNICEINYQTQYCALPGEFIVKENSFYVETMSAKDDVVLCSTCGYKGVIKKTKQTPGFMCLCQVGFYGDRCQHEMVVDDLNSSPILNGKADYIRQLSSWLPDSNTWKLCWRASEHGWAATTFHSQCDNKGPTVTVVRVGVYVFGGYADVSWKSPASTPDWARSENPFLFSLKNNDDLKPFKAPVYQYSDRALRHHSFFGPSFGVGWDLYISNNANLNTKSYTKFGKTYQLPPGYTYATNSTNALLAGSLHFTPSEVEVFYLQ